MNDRYQYMSVSDFHGSPLPRNQETDRSIFVTGHRLPTLMMRLGGESGSIWLIFSMSITPLLFNVNWCFSHLFLLTNKDHKISWKRIASSSILNQNYVFATFFLSKSLRELWTLSYVTCLCSSNFYMESLSMWILYDIAARGDFRNRRRGRCRFLRRGKT